MRSGFGSQAVVGSGRSGFGGVAAGPTLFTDKAAAFSSSNHLDASAGSRIDFTTGTTLILTFQVIAAPAASWEHILSSTNGLSFGSAKGFWLVRAGNDSGADAGKITLLSGAGGTLGYFYAPPGVGSIVTLAIVWTATTNVIAYVANGSAQLTHSGPAPAAQDGTCLARIGGTTSGFGACTTLRLLNYALINSALTAGQCSTLTYTTGSRYQLQTGVTSIASQWMQFSAALAGNPSSVTTGGTSPISLAVTGAPSLVNVAERRFPASLPNAWDSKSAVAQVDGNGVAYTIRRPYARRRYTSDAILAAVESYSTIFSTNTQAVTGLYVNGTWTSETLATQTGVPYLNEVSTGAGSSKAIDIWEGPEVMAVAIGGAHLGTFVQAVRFATLATDGTTAYATTARTPTAVQKRLALFSDSIFTGFYATPMTQHSVTPDARADFPTSGTGGVTCASVGLESVHNLASSTALADATAASVIAELDGTSVNYLVCGLGTNDYGSLQVSAATFDADCRRLLTSIAALKGNVPGFVMYWMTPVPRIAPASPQEGANANGSTMADFRSVIAALPSTFPWLTVIDGTAIGLVSGDYYTDGIHLVTSGDTKIKAAIKTALGY